MVKRRTEMPSLEQLAETLILVDVADPGSVTELVGAFSEFAAWAKGPGVAPEVADVAADCVCTVTGMAGAEDEAALAALGELGHLFERLQNTVLAFASAEGQDADDGPSAPATRGRTAGPAAGSDSAPTGICDDPALIADFVVRATELLDSADEQLVVLERSPGRRDVLDEVFRSFHTLKGMAGFLSLDQLQATAHDAESILDGPRHGEARLEQQDLVALFEAVDEMKRRVAAVSAGPALASAMSTKAANLVEGMPGGEEAPAVRMAAGGDTGESAAATLARATVRVDEGRLDRLLDAIGEMVIAEAMASETMRSDSGNADRLAGQLARLDKITREMQELATSLRMMPLGPTFRRMSRVVRDLSHATGKRVELVLSGAETELDKEMVDRLGDPLIHLLRNAIDHGIESPEVRAAAGKDATGRVELRAYHHGGSVLVEVCDDGSGLDAQAISERARAHGLLAEGVDLDEQATLGLILQPGFSTARTVTDVSGRGVGLDVVKRAVDDLRGQVSVESTPGQGTRFTIRLPLTLAIIDGMVLRVGAERYIVPTGAIERSVRPTAAQLATVLSRGTVLVTDDGLVPLLHLGALFEEPGAEPDPCRAIVVICEAGNRRVGLVACELLGQQQTVIKGLGDDLRGASGLAGGAIMADGRVGLILDVTGLVTLANAEGGE